MEVVGGWNGGSGRMRWRGGGRVGSDGKVMGKWKNSMEAEMKRRLKF